SEGWTLVDTRDGEVMARDGAIPGALCIALSSPVAKTGSSICRDGFSSSLAAVRLHDARVHRDDRCDRRLRRVGGSGSSRGEMSARPGVGLPGTVTMREAERLAAEAE